MRKTFKIIAIFAIMVIIVVAFGTIILLDVAAYTATGLQTLTPTGISIGKAIVIYDTRLSGTAKGVTDNVAVGLQTKRYTGTLAGIKSSVAGTMTGYNIIVIGGPIYAGGLASSAKGAVESLVLNHDQGAKLVFSEADQGQHRHRT